MSKIIFIPLFAGCLLQSAYAQNVSSYKTVEYTYTTNTTETFLAQKFKNFESKDLRNVIGQVSLFGEAQLSEYTFKRTGKFRDRIEIIQKTDAQKVIFQIEVAESTFLYFLNEKERIKEREEYIQYEPLFFTSIKK
jgi:hypothetical protein